MTGAKLTIVCGIVAAAAFLAQGNYYAALWAALCAFWAFNYHLEVER